MPNKKPTSFKIFIIIFSITALVILSATLLSYYKADKKYSMFLALIMFVALAFSTVGIYSGFKYKSEVDKYKLQNKIGLIGSLIIFLFTISLMTMAAFMKTK